MKSQISIGIVEDHNIVRKGLVSTLRGFERIKVLFEAANGEELLIKLKTAKPDILLVDIEMPVMSGRVVVGKIKEKYPKIKIIIMTGFPEEASVIEFVKKGVNSFLDKDHTIDELLAAIYAVYESGSYFGSKVSAIIAKELAATNNRVSEEPGLSPQDIAIIRLIWQGKTSKEIADNLNLSLKTIEFHRSKIFKKTNSRNVSALMQYAIQNNIVKKSK